MQQEKHLFQLTEVSTKGIKGLLCEMVWGYIEGYQAPNIMASCQPEVSNSCPTVPKLRCILYRDCVIGFTQDNCSEKANGSGENLPGMGMTSFPCASTQATANCPAVHPCRNKIAQHLLQSTQTVATSLVGMTTKGSPTLVYR